MRQASNSAGRPWPPVSAAATGVRISCENVPYAAARDNLNENEVNYQGLARCYFGNLGHASARLEDEGRKLQRLLQLREWHSSESPHWLEIKRQIETRLRILEECNALVEMTRAVIHHDSVFERYHICLHNPVAKTLKDAHSIINKNVVFLEHLKTAYGICVPPQQAGALGPSSEPKNVCYLVYNDGDWGGPSGV